MSTITHAPIISVDDYIARFVEGEEEPTCEYLDGELIPMGMATKQHGRVQINVGRLIGNKYWSSLNPLTETKTRLRESRFCIPDLIVEELANPIEGRYPGPPSPVLLCVEILSPPHRIGKLFSKCEEYHAWGVPYRWVFDPERKLAWEYLPDDSEPRKLDGDSIIAGPITLALGDVFERVYTSFSQISLVLSLQDSYVPSETRSGARAQANHAGADFGR